MSHTAVLGGLHFDEAFVSAKNDKHEFIKFTRAEAKLLSFFVKHPDQVLSRTQLLNAINTDGKTSMDRSIDFLINRLRQKLADNPKEPVFIATRYGEGYIWVARPEKVISTAVGSQVVVGPVFGLEHISDFGSTADAFSKRFYKSFRRHFSSDKMVSFDIDCPDACQFRGDAPEVGVELNFIFENDVLECVFRGYIFGTGVTVFARRVAVQSAKVTSPDIKAIATELAGVLRTNLAKQSGEQIPLAVGLIEAGKTFTGIKGHWSENDQRLRTLVQRNSDDWHSKIMLATNLHTKYLQDGVQLFSSNDDPRQTDENEIELLVTDSLPHIQDQPTYLLPAAKLLYFIGHGYRDLAFEIAERVHKNSMALSASLPVVGQMRVFEGQNEEGLAAINQALERCKTGSQFEVYLQVLKCEALAAVNAREELDRVLHHICSNVPQIEVLMQFLFTCAERPAKAAQQALVNMSTVQAKAMLMFTHYVYARLLVNPEHRANAYRTPLSLLQKQFGPGIVPDEVNLILGRTADDKSEHSIRA